MRKKKSSSDHLASIIKDLTKARRDEQRALKEARGARDHASRLASQRLFRPKPDVLAQAQKKSTDAQTHLDLVSARIVALEHEKVQTEGLIKAEAGVRTEPAGDVLARVDSALMSVAGLTETSIGHPRKYPTIIGSGVDVLGPWFDVRVIPGIQTVESFAAAAARIASAWHVAEVEVTSPATHVARIQSVEVLEGDGLANIDLPWKHRDLAPSVVEYVSALPMGINRATNQPWFLDLREHNYFAGGLPGMGKSSLVNGLLGHLCAHPHIRIAYIDLKNGVEAGPWRQRLDYTDANAADNEGVRRAAEFLAAAIADTNARYTRMEAAGVTNAWTEGFLGANEPLKVLIIDEISELFKGSVDRRLGDQCEASLKSLVQKGRAAGYVVIMATQFPKEENLPSSIRDNASHVAAFSVKQRAMYSLFGTEHVPVSALVDPRRIHAKGQCVFAGVDCPDGIRVQVGWLDRETKQKIVAVTAQHQRNWLDYGPLN